jgi:hypothetical protein
MPEPVREHSLRLEIHMQHWNRLPRFLLVLSLLIGLCAGMLAPRLQKVEAKPVAADATNIVISEFRFIGDDGGNDEFIELYNPTSNPIDISGWLISGSNNANPPSTSTRATINAGVILQPGQYYLIANNGFTGPVSPDQTYGTGITNDGGVALVLPDGITIIDQVGLSTGSAYIEGTNLAQLTTNVDRGYERKVGGTNGSCVDDNDNSTDFLIRNPSNPQNSSSTATTCGYAPLGYAPLSVIINEVAWAGTLASPDDEWIELHNPGATNIDLTGWRLVASDGSPDITLSGIITAGGYYLLERGSENVVQGITANFIFTGTLADSGEFLRLRAPDGTLVDTANSGGGAWPAGTISPPRSMERMGVIADALLAWTTFNDTNFTAQDAAGNDIYGTPGSSNWGYGVTHTPTPTNTPTITPSPTLTNTITSTASKVRSVIINEIAWAGTTSSLSSDEWIELYNPTNQTINITGWRLVSADGTPNIILSGSIPSGGYFLLERGDDNTVLDIVADQIYTGELSNSGERLTLYDVANMTIDTANGNGGFWPAGSSFTYGTMERNGVIHDNDTAWHTNTGSKRNGKNANGGNILGTPKNSNSPAPAPTPTRTRTPIRTSTPTRTPTRTPTALPPSINARLIINEILARPSFDWNKDGIVDVYDEFIEIKNLSPINVDLKGWKLDKLGGGTFSLPNVTLKPGEHIVFYSKQTNLLLSDGGETIRLYNPQGKIYDAYTYSFAREADRSFCRLPDGNVFGNWFEDCIPTPNLTNTREGRVPSMPGGDYESPVCELPDTIPADFLFAECHSYGAGIWNAYYWDRYGWGDRKFIQENMSKWESFVE